MLCYISVHFIFVFLSTFDTACITTHLFSFLLTAHPTKWTYGYPVVFCKGTIALNNSGARVLLLVFFLKYFGFFVFEGGFGNIYWYACCYSLWPKIELFATKILLLEMNIPLNSALIVNTEYNFVGQP